MLKEFMLFFALALFALSAYYVIQFANGSVPVHTGVVAIISMVGTVAYPVYYFSPLNSAHREQLLDTIMPFAAVAEMVTKNPLDSIERRVRGVANDGFAAFEEGVDRTTGGVANAAVAYGSTALLATASYSVAPGLAAFLSGPFGWVLLPLFAFLIGFTRNSKLRVYGGKRPSKKKA